MSSGEVGDSAPHVFAHSPAHTTTKSVTTTISLATSADYH